MVLVGGSPVEMATMFVENDGIGVGDVGFGVGLPEGFRIVDTNDGTALA